MNSLIPSTILLAYASFCITNTADTILPKLQDNHRPNTSLDHKFYHPFIQTQMVEIGQMLCLFAFLIVHNGPKVSCESSKPKAPIVLQITSNVLKLIAINYLSGSVYSITNSVVIAFTAIFSKIIMKTIFNKFQIFGCILVMAGVSVTAFGEQSNTNSQQQQNHLLIGIAAILIAQIFAGFQIVFIQYVFEKYSTSSIQFLGISGIIGTVLLTLLLILFSFIGCPFDEGQCVKDSYGNYHLEHFPTFFRDVSNDSFLAISTIAYILVSARLYYDINEIIINGNAMIYQILTCLSFGFIWTVGILITLLGNGRQQFVIESLSIKVLSVKLIGYAFVVLGVLLYDKIIYREKDQQSNELMEETIV